MELTAPKQHLPHLDYKIYAVFLKYILQMNQIKCVIKAKQQLHND